MSCDSPISWEALVDWWAGDLEDAEAMAVEEHLLGCEAWAAEANRVAATAESVRTMIPPVVGPERLRALEDAGVRVFRNPVAPGTTCDFHFPQNAQLAVHVLGGLSFRPGAQVEVTLRSIATGNVLGRIADAPVDAGRGVLYLACQRDYAELDHDLIAEVRVAPDAPAARYTILHHF